MNTDLTFRCECQRLLEVPAVLSGLRVRCPACRRILVAPVAEAVPVARLVDPPPPAPAPSRLTRPALHAVPPPATPLSVAANIIAVLGFLLFGASLVWVVGAPGGCASIAPPVLVIGVAAALFLFIVSGRNSGGTKPAADSRPLTAASARAAIPARSTPAVCYLIGIPAFLMWMGSLSMLAHHGRDADALFTICFIAAGLTGAVIAVRRPVIGVLAIVLMGIAPMVAVFPSRSPRPPRPLPVPIRVISPCNDALLSLRRDLSSQSVARDADLLQLARVCQNIEPCPCARRWRVFQEKYAVVVACPEHPSSRIPLQFRYSRTTAPQGTK